MNNYENYHNETKKWNTKKWKEEMDLNNTNVGDFIEGMWFNDGYSNGYVELINGEKGITPNDYSVAMLNNAHSFRKIKGSE